MKDKSNVLTALVHARESASGSLDGMCTELETFLNGYGLPQLSADEVMYELHDKDLTDEDRIFIVSYLTAFIDRWDQTQETVSAINVEINRLDESKAFRHNHYVPNTNTKGQDNDGNS